MHKDKYFIYSVLTLALISQLVFPLLGILILFLITLTPWKIETKTQKFMVAATAAFFLSHINMYRVPESDLVRYLEFYNQVPYTSFFDYIAIFKEPLYNVVVYVLYSTSFGNDSLFIFQFSFLVYFVYLTAILIACESLGLTHRNAVFCVLLAALFPLTFSLSGHLLRQVLAVSVLTYLWTHLVYRSQIASWKLLAFPPFIHTTSVAVVIPLFFLKSQATTLKYKVLNLLVFIVAISGGVYWFLNSSYLQYVQTKIDNKNWDILQTLGVLPKLYLLFVFLFCGILLFRCKKDNDLQVLGVHHLLIVVGLLSGVCFILSLIPSVTELAMRFSVYVYFLFYLLLPVAIFFFRRQFNAYTRSIIILIQFSWFITALFVGRFSFENLHCSLLSPLLCLT